MCVCLMNPRTGGVFASFGAHPSLEVALERSLTELLQGRSLEGLNDLPRPTFESNAVTEPNNFVEHFIDSSGVVSWRFFSARADHDFVEWDFSGQGENSNVDEAATLFGILEGMGKEVYMAVYDQLGATACRILVPGYSEIYPVEDLIWDNTNKALSFRADILNLHRLDDAGLEALLERLEDSELDDYTDIITLIGIEFDENTDWGQLTILELKLLINLALRHLNRRTSWWALPAIQRKHGRARLVLSGLNVVLEVLLDDELELAITRPISAACSAIRAWMRCWDRWTAACASWPDADEHEAGRPGPAPAPDRQLQETAHGAGQGGGGIQSVARSSAISGG
jgi:ribosomal protein S12 methylthiotransferase accessory factor